MLQSTRYYSRMKIARAGGFEPLHVMAEDLAGGTDPHPDPVVTKESMLAAFPKMKEPQANVLMKWLQKDANALEHLHDEDEVTRRVNQCGLLMKTVAENLHAVSLTVMRCDNRLVALERSQLNNLGPGKGQPSNGAPSEPAAEPAAELVAA